MASSSCRAHVPRWMPLLFLFAPHVSAYTAPGLLSSLVQQKKREVERLRIMPEAREDGPWGLCLGYPATCAHYSLSRSIGWRRERMAVVADLKVYSSGRKLGEQDRVFDNMVVTETLDMVADLGAIGALVSTDKMSYGGSPLDLADACRHTSMMRNAMGADFPIVAKDFIIDPLQIARAVCLGAHAVLLIAAAAPDQLPELLDTCTLLGVEALVEVHTTEEIELAAECGASLFLVTERDRELGVLVPGQACAASRLIPVEATLMWQWLQTSATPVNLYFDQPVMICFLLVAKCEICLVRQACAVAPALPGDAISLACGGISTMQQVRELRGAGYDGVVLGRALAAAGAKALMDDIRAEEWSQRLAEPIYSAPVSRSSAAKLADGGLVDEAGI
eukprot:6193105-Pleurochrysis_carterae.AAC.1